MNVGAVVWSEKSVLLVQQQGPDDPKPCWALPGGRVEPGETLLEAAAREVQEETGLVIPAVGRLVYMMEYMLSRVQAPGGLSFVFEVTEWSGRPRVNDPEDDILDVRFVPIAEAISLLDRHLPIPRMRDPVLAFLRGEAGYGAYWLYGRNEDGDEIVLGRTREERNA